MSVTVEWAQQVGATYTVRVLPLAPIMFIGSTSRQLIISYNTEYNLSVEATAPCRPNACRTTSKELHQFVVRCVSSDNMCRAITTITNTPHYKLV